MDITTYWVKIGEELESRVFEEASEELQKELKEAVEQYTLHYDCVDWADDTRDAGWGYDYDNSYELYLEPQISQMVAEKGRLIGIVIRPQYPMLRKILLFPDGGEYDKAGSSPFHDSRNDWEIKKDLRPQKGRYVCGCWDEKNKDKVFTPEDFPQGLVQKIAKVQKIEDNYGHYDDEVRIWLALTEEALTDRDTAVDALSKAGLKFPQIVKYIKEMDETQV